MILRRKAVAPSHEWEADVEDSVPELNEAVEVSPPAVGAEDVVVGLVVLDADPIFWLSANFLVADDYRLDPSYNLPFTKSDDVVANERVGVQIHEHLFTFPDIGIETGSIKDNSKKNETNNNNPTKRLGEVDYTKGRIFKFTAYSARET